MRTRRSPRNQERLWRELGAPPAPKPATDPIAALERILARPGINARTRRQLERDLERARHRAAVRRALEPKP